MPPVPTASDLCELIDRLQRSADGLSSLETGYALYEAAVQDGLVESGVSGQGVIAGWVGDLVNDDRLRPTSRAGGSPEAPMGMSWGDAQLQSHYRYRLTDGGRVDARETRHLRRQRTVEHLLAGIVNEDSLATLSQPARDAVDHHLQTVRRAIERDDPAAVIGAAKELVEAAAKIVLARAGVQPNARASLGQLYRQALVATGRSDQEAPGFTMSRGAASLIDRLAQLRNKHGSGHGRPQPPDAEQRDGRLAARVAVAATEYLLSD